ncbi:MAG: molecular chaperone HtpG [candidate division KSB1 bacterium]|jgi:molecular chaperone HtpG|nr:molecular chaperone HtpG [candidate division KSB1 bacterium]
MAQTKEKPKRYQFKAEIKQLLDILVHSLYTNREIFVRELVSNAADALDKARFEEIRGSKIADPDLPFEIHIDLDEENKKFTITDTGIGMSREELVANIGTIAHSGSADFIKKIAGNEQQGPELIGQFGVGFYSVFMAGSEVLITTQSHDPKEDAFQWRSDGTGSYTIKNADKAPRGTKIEVTLREDAHEFSEKARIENVIKRYSNFVPFPIKINGEQVNTISAIWREPKSSVKKDQYIEFYKFITNGSEEPLSHMHISSDAPIQFSSIIYIPATNPEMIGFPMQEEGMNLFVKRILVQPNCKDLLPNYLRFLRGVVDSEDIPLNISRETLQENLLISKIRNVLTKKVLGHLKDMAEKEPDKYAEFWKQFGRNLKEGYTDFMNRDEIIKLFRFNSSSHENEDQLTSLEEYVKRMAENQNSIYYLSGSSREVIQQNPHLEMFRKKGLEVLYLYEPIDEFFMTNTQEFDGKKFASADQVEPESLDEIKAESEEDAKNNRPKDDRKLADLCARIKNILGDRITEVKPSARLTDSPAVLVNPDGSMSAQMQKIMQTISKDSNVPPKVMEINGKHPLIKNMLKLYTNNPKDKRLTKTVENLYHSVVLLDGYLPDPHKIVAGLQELLLDSSKLYVKSQ